MLESYFQTSSVNMTKDTYFEMCEALGTEPSEDEIPIDQNDFPVEVQSAMELYYILKDDWDTMNGVYLGKSYVGLSDILDILDIPKSDRKLVLDWISTMDSSRAKTIAESKPKK